MKTSFLVIFILLLAIGNSNGQIYGCPDPLATNYNPSAIDNDGSCIYPVSSVSPVTSFALSNNLQETSGLVKWNGQLWTHNDNSDINLYSLDTADGTLIQSYPLTGTVNVDWEEISQDSSYVYVGDFGNNLNGNRTDLKILRIEKNSLLAQAPIIDTIAFSYADQVDFSGTSNNSTDFDCEAFVVSTDSIYLFTKQWVSNKTSLYVLPKTPGSYVAVLKTTFDVQGLVTGAVLLQNERIVGLSGYTSLLQPFTWLLYDFTGSEYFSGNKREVSISLPFHQAEGITTSDGLTWYMTNENFPLAATPQKLYLFDLTPYLGNYINNLTQDVSIIAEDESFLLYPNPAFDKIILESKTPFQGYRLTNVAGETVKTGKLVRGHSEINISELPGGMYFLDFVRDKNFTIKVVRK